LDAIPRKLVTFGDVRYDDIDVCFTAVTCGVAVDCDVVAACALAVP
jgi:hypothetical protein